MSVLGFDARNRDSYVAVPAGISDDVPAGISLELLLIEIRQSLRTTAFPFSAHRNRFDLPMDEALAVVRLSDDGFSDEAAWWLAREASVANCVAAIPENT